MPETLQRKRRRRRLTLLALALACCAPSPTLAHDARRHGSVALRPRHGHHDAAAVHHRRTSPSAHANASAVVDASASLAKGRFGHSSVYLPDSNQVLFVGGQIGKLSSDGETLITNDVLALNLSAPFDSAAHQPSESPDLAKLVMPQAWAATAVDRMGNVWTIGGLTQDCAADAVASVLDVTHETSAPALAGRAATSGPPRRRQAHAVALADSTGGDNATDIYVWGGLAEPYTCSIDTVGYLAMDIWSSSTSGRSVRTVQFKTPKDAPERYRPPISDYATAALDDGRIVVIGGQTTDGSLTPMNRVLVFDPVASNWSIIIVSGDLPQPRIGHVAVALPGGTQILVHGGVSTDRVPRSDMHVLDTSKPSQWTWSLAPGSSTGSVPAPALSWHTAIGVPNGDDGPMLVVGYGVMDANGSTSSALYFLSCSATGWTWSRSYEPAPVATPSVTTVTWTQPAQTVIPTSTTYIIPVVLAPLTSTPVALASSSPSTDAADLQPSSSSPSGKAVAGSVSAVVLVGLVAVGIGYFLRRRAKAARANSWPDALGPTEQRGGVPVVSTLLYTRRSAKRRLSLGSTATGRSADATPMHIDVAHWPSTDPSGTPDHSTFAPPTSARWFAVNGSRPGSAVVDSRPMLVSASAQTGGTAKSYPLLRPLQAEAMSATDSGSTMGRAASTRSASSTATLKPLIMASAATIASNDSTPPPSRPLSRLFNFLSVRAGGWASSAPSTPMSEVPPPTTREMVERPVSRALTISTIASFESPGEDADADADVVDAAADLSATSTIASFVSPGERRVDSPLPMLPLRAALDEAMADAADLVHMDDRPPSLL